MEKIINHKLHLYTLINYDVFFALEYKLYHELNVNDFFSSNQNEHR